MTEKAKPNPQELEGDGLGDAPSAADAAADGADSAADGNGEKGADVVELMQELDEAKARAAELENRLLRAHAEFENYRRRVQREKEDLAVYANQKLVLNLLPVLDNLDRALGTPAAPGDEKLRQGVELTARSFRDILAKEGVTVIEAVGKPFDPNFHEAVMTVESDEHDDETVMSEFQKGYQLGDRVIRPSMVQVSKKG
ncbi:MAG: heat-shock protein [Symbiobacteriaceae bacterium]|jgi:molecular chaperone GrpE|nr:heat-shock protein [Symbiobacteriaceae bacterium]